MTTRWERLALFEGGSVADLAAAQATDGSWHVFAATAVGVFRSVDRGRTWAPLGAGRRVAGAEVVAASPRYAEDGLVYAGAPDGLYLLSAPDAGWQHILSGGPIGCIALDVGNRDARPDASGLTVFVGTQEDGILVSRNGGRTWEGANAGLLSLCAFDLALSPSFGEDGIAFAAMEDGLYRTRNGAESWRQLDTDTEDDGFQAVAVSPGFSEDRLVLADCFNAGLFRSDDGGRTWNRIDLRDSANATDDEPRYGSVGDIFRLTLLSSERAIAWTEFGVTLSSDGGQSWHLDWERSVAQGIEQVTAGVCLPAAADESEALLAGAADDGVLRSEDGGKTWAPSSGGLHVALTSDLLLSPAFADDRAAYTVMLGAPPRMSHDGGHTWRPINDSVEAPEEADDGSDPQRGGSETANLLGVVSAGSGTRVLVGGSLQGVLLSGDDGATWRPAWTDAPFATAEPPRQQAVQMLATTQTEKGAHILAAISTERGEDWFLVGSRDGGQTWTEIPMPNGRTFVKRLAVTPDAGLDGVLYVAVHSETDGGFALWRSADGGRRWQLWYADADLHPTMTTPLLALPANPWGDTVVLAAGDRVLRPRPNAWEVREGVRRPAWDATMLTDDSQPGTTVVVAGLAASPGYAQDRTLFAATSAGVYVSRDGGQSFSQWNDGLEAGAAVAVAISPAYTHDRLVYALGLGGSIWRRTDD